MCLTLLATLNNNLVKCRLWHLNKKFLSKHCLSNQFINRNQIELCIRTRFRTMATTSDQLFQGNQDRFNGITVDSVVENCKLEDFTIKLDDSLKIWTEANKRGIWFKVALEHAEWVPILAKNGFNFHHAKDGFVMMYKWLPKEDNNIPAYSHTMIGVGAVVVNEKNQILVVREKYWTAPHWKLPGGYVEPRENFIDAAIREVYEETNIHTEFSSILNLRHGHNVMFGCSDLYIVVSLKPLSSDIAKCEREIVACEWMDINEYLQHPNIHELNRFFVHSYLEYKKNDFKIDCKHGIHQVLKKPYTVYYVTKKSNDT